MMTWIERARMVRDVVLVFGIVTILWACGVSVADAQATFPTPAPGMRAPSAVALKCDAGANGPANCRPVTATDPMPTAPSPVSSTPSAAGSGTIATSGTTVAVPLTAGSRVELINPSTASLWASYGTPGVNAAGSFKIAPDQAYVADRQTGTLTILSTAASQPYTLNRFTY